MNFKVLSAGLSLFMLSATAFAAGSVPRVLRCQIISNDPPLRENLNIFSGKGDSLNEALAQASMSFEVQDKQDVTGWGQLTNSPKLKVDANGLITGTLEFIDGGVPYLLSIDLKAKSIKLTEGSQSATGSCQIKDELLALPVK